MKYHLSYTALTEFGLLKASCNNRQLFINDTIINFEDDITGVSIGKSKVFVQFTRIDEAGVSQPKNNVYAYDLTGCYLWNIGDIIKEERSYTRMSIHDAASFARYEDHGDKLPIECGHEYLVCYTFGDQRMIIDVNEMKVIQIKGGYRW